LKAFDEHGFHPVLVWLKEARALINTLTFEKVIVLFEAKNTI
jgi:hypothetical protein